MNCREFRETYSDYADGFLDPQREVEARLHLEACAACRHFDAAFRAGVRALRALPEMALSRGFAPRLKRRLGHEFAVRLPVVAHWSGAAGTLLLIAMVGFVAWEVKSPARAAAPAAHWWSHRTAKVALVTGPLAAPVVVSARLDTDAAELGAFHPLESVMLAADTFAEVAAGRQPRYKLPAAWGGR